MEKLLYIPAAITAFAFFIKSLLHSLHMLQLSSYKNERYISWCKKNSSRLAKTYLPLLILGAAASGFAMISNGVTYLLLTAIFVLSFLLSKNQLAKKPLGYTARIKRLLVTNLLLFGGALTAGYFWSLGFILVVLIGIFAPLAALLTNIINSPLELAAYKWYFNDAKKKLAAHKDLIVIGITGSYGKTSTKFALGKILSVAYNTLITPENKNTPMGLAKVIRSSLSPTHEVFVAEMGAAKKGDITELCKLVNPDHGVISSIGPQHLETMGSIEMIIKTKYTLADHVAKKGGTVFLNDDNEYIQKQTVQGEVIRYGTTAGLDFWAEDIHADASGTSFTLCTKDGKSYPCSTKLLGRYNALNILGAVSVGCKLNIKIEDMLPAIRRLEPVPHRLQLITKPGGLTIIDDAYNSNPSGAQMALETLGCFDGMKILITPGMVELGAKEQELNHQLGSRAAAHCDLIILVGGDRVLPIAQGAKDAGFDPEKIVQFPTIQEALAEAKKYIAQKPVVLLENDLPDNYL